SRTNAGRGLILICRNIRRAGRDPLRSFYQEFRIEHEYRRGTPPCRSAVQKRTAVARGPASNDRVRGRTAGDARKDRALAGASVGSRRRQSENADRALIVETLARLRSRSCIIDGEAVACDDYGVASFDLVRHQRASGSIFLMPSTSSN